MSNSIESGSGAQSAPRPEPEDVPNYERPIEPEHAPPAEDPTPSAPQPPTPDPAPPAPASDPETPATTYGPPDPTLQSIKRRIDDLQAAAFAEAEAPTEADLREFEPLDEVEAVEAQATATPEAEPTEPSAQAWSAGPAPGASGERRPLAQDEERLFAVLSHLSAFVFPILGPLVFMLINQGRSEWLDEQVKEALNFQLNVVGWSFVLFLASFVLIGLCGLPVLALAGVVLPIVGAIQAYSGKKFRYPFILRLLR